MSITTPHGTFGNACRNLRVARGWTQAQLARKLGLSQVAIAWYETGRSVPSPKNMRLMALTFSVPFEFLQAHKRSLFEAR